jgi:hypothetical protein
VSGVLLHKSTKASYLHGESAVAGGTGQNAHTTRSARKPSRITVTGTGGLATGHTTALTADSKLSGGERGSIKTNTLVAAPHDSAASAAPKRSSPMRAPVAPRAVSYGSGGGGGGSASNTPTNANAITAGPRPSLVANNPTGDKHRVTAHRPSLSTSKQLQPLHSATTTNTNATTASTATTGAAPTTAAASAGVLHRVQLRTKSVTELPGSHEPSPRDRVPAPVTAGAGAAHAPPSASATADHHPSARVVIGTDSPSAALTITVNPNAPSPATPTVPAATAAGATAAGATTNEPVLSLPPMNATLSLAPPEHQASTPSSVVLAPSDSPIALPSA